VLRLRNTHWHFFFVGGVVRFFQRLVSVKQGGDIQSDVLYSELLKAVVDQGGNPMNKMTDSRRPARGYKQRGSEFFEAGVFRTADIVLRTGKPTQPIEDKNRTRFRFETV
jgi:hypothetical protein